MKYVEFVCIGTYLLRTCLGFVRLDPSFIFIILKLDISKSYSEIVLTKNRQDSANLAKIPDAIILGVKSGFLGV